MHRPRPHRIPGFSYVGFHRYSVRLGTANRVRAFLTAAIVDPVLSQLRQCVSVEQFALIAYCFMPDHVHVLVEGVSEGSHLPRLVACWKQQTGYWYGRKGGSSLWQSGYYDHVLRDDEATVAVARYILENPVRAGLAEAIDRYPFSGSDAYPVALLAGDLQRQR
jgi:putative transposase